MTESLELDEERVVDAAVSLAEAEKDAEKLAAWAEKFGAELLRVVSRQKAVALRMTRAAKIAVEAAAQGAKLATEVLNAAAEAKRMAVGVEPVALVESIAGSIGLIAAKMAVSEAAMHCDGEDEVRMHAIGLLREFLPMLFDEEAERKVAEFVARVN